MTEKLTVFRIGQIVNTQGLKGEVRVYPYTDDINRFDELDYFYIDKNLNNKYEVERVRYKGNMVIMKIKGIDSIELAEKLKTKNMYIVIINPLTNIFSLIAMSLIIKCIISLIFGIV